MTNVEFHGSSRGKMLFLSKLSLKRFLGKRSVVFLSYLALGAITQVFLQSAEAQIKYTVTRLVPISGVSSYPTGLNAQGDVVGTYIWRNGTQHVFLSHAGVMHDVGDLAGSSPTGINIFGRIVGSNLASVGGPTPGFQPYTYFEQKAWSLSRTILNLYPVGVNTASHIVCGSASGALIWAKSGIAFLPVPSTFRPTAINNSDQVVGIGFDLQGRAHAFLISGGQAIDLGSLQNGDTEAYAVNDQGQVTGHSNFGRGRHAFIYSAGKIQDIQTTDPSNSSLAFGINNSGQVVGQFWADFDFIHAFVYDGSQMIDLDTLIDPASGWALDAAWAINDAGQIIATGFFQNAKHEACLLTPVQ